MGHGYWPMTVSGSWVLTNDPCDPSQFVDPFSPWPTDPLSALTLRSLALKESSGRPSPKSKTRTQNTSNFSQKLRKRIDKHMNFVKICMIFVPLFSQDTVDTPMERTPPESETIFIFQKVKPTWNEPDLSSVYIAACLLHLRNKLCQRAWWQTRPLLLLSVAQTRIFEHLSATFNETETHKGRGYVWKANIAHVCFVWKRKKLKKLFKCPLVNETLWSETETRPRCLAFSLRRDQDRDLPTLCRDRDETETFEKYVSRPSRDRDVETETTTLVYSLPSVA